MPESNEVDTPLQIAESVGISRRDFIRFNASLFACSATKISVCTPVEPLDNRTTFRILRADDQMALQFRLQNLRIA